MATAYPLDPIQTAISVAYHNPRYIADMVLPRVQVGAEKFKWHSYREEESYRLPESRASRRGRLSEVQIAVDEHDSSTIDYGLAGSVPAPDQQQAGQIPGYDPVGQLNMTLSDYIALGREKRVADLVFDAAQYPSGNKVQLSGTDQWDVAHAESDPFELDRVLVGEQRLNTAAYGQTATLARVWGNHCLLAYLSPLAQADGMSPTFGLTAEYMTRSAGTREVPPGEMGIRGGTRLWVGESLKELIIAPLAAYLIEDAVGS
jgi:hypothetical protein